MESDPPLQGVRLNEAISVAMVDPYERFYGHDQIRARTFIDGRVAFQEATEDEFTAAVERLTRRRVVSFLSANQTNPGVACELFFLERRA